MPMTSKFYAASIARGGATGWGRFDELECER
jgi:hypothetical protein